MRRRSSSSSCWTRTRTITSTTPVCSAPTVVPQRSVSREQLSVRGLYRSHMITLPAAEQWSAEHTASLVELYDSIMAADPKAYTAQRIALALVSGEQSHPPSPFRIPAEDVGRASRRRVRDPAECVREALSPAGHSFSVYRSEGALHGRSESKKLSRSPLRGALTGSVVHRLPSSRRSSKESSHRSGHPAHSRVLQIGRRPR